ncbi:D-erythronate dehydrogenase [uncultured Propionivibrio sp.]|uniref:D-erythronate dehydrogenase n=1 Tax=uncultured Propionivibrio sp. TaxID=426737 RepID=UPI0029C0690B|nr:D-erythronate dehydrogenase [uncultured Propionivibrio sp.]
MNVLITGGAGFLGQKLARRLLEKGSLKNADGVETKIDRLFLFDIVPAPDFSDPRVTVVTGDIGNESDLARALDAQTTSVFHLAAIVSSQAEADFDLGMRINVDAFRVLLERCRRLGQRPKVLFASSVAVYGGPLPAVVQDDTALNPKSSYGIQKAIGELMLSDFSRKGFIDGRGLRLPTISVRPGKPNKAASSFASGIIREPLNGEDTVCPVTPDTRLWLLSPRQVIENMIWAHNLPSDGFELNRMVNLPGVNVSVSEMIDALRTVAGEAAVAHIRWEHDATIQRIVGSWPACWNPKRALAMGFKGDASFEAAVRAYLADDKP